MYYNILMKNDKMQLTQSERIRLVRRRLKLTRHQFYGSICSPDEARYIEHTEKYENCSSKNRNMHSYVERCRKSHYAILDVLRTKYSDYPLNVTTGEKAMILRWRAGYTINDISKKIGRSRIWVLNAENGALRYDEHNETHAQELCDLYD